MKNEKYILKYRQKTMILIAYFSMIFLILMIFKDITYPSLAIRIFYILFCISGGFGLFYFFNYMYNKKVIISQNGVIIKKFLQKPIFIDWKNIIKVQFKHQGFSVSEAASLGVQGPLIYGITRNIGKSGTWTVTIDTLKKKYKINLYLIPFSSIKVSNSSHFVDTRVTNFHPFIVSMKSKTNFALFFFSFIIVSLIFSFFYILIK